MHRNLPARRSLSLFTALFHVLFVALNLSLLPAALAAPSAAIDSDHPFLGTWVLPINNSRCMETYYIRADGTSLVTSAEEVAETNFEISPKPSRLGFYRWVDKLVKGNGKKDCSGKISKIGIESTSYIRFINDGERVIICQNESLNACFGPMQRLRGTAL